MVGKKQTKVAISVSITYDMLEKLEDYATERNKNRSDAAGTLMKLGWSYWDDKLRVT